MIALEIISIIIGVVLLIVAVWLEKNAHDGSSAISWFAGCIFTIGLFLICAKIEDNKPTAMEVYQGKTTLQYTIIDSVKVDSVVVWKSKEK